MPINTFSPKKPFKAKVKSVERIVGPKATGETCHIIVETNGDIPFWEGQSYGVVPPVRSLCYHTLETSQEPVPLFSTSLCPLRASKADIFQSNPGIQP